ncbi:MAG: TetR/AcrR family transcriptional regulator [Alphaproteobacteria bacterium]|jgi:AcrR family transcriptional regulator|nr:TetR/AcrR family transcriptional regulator [Alphaproteobacteria bacterium]MDP6830071.1 TetR/AcrR family transcriptional regulator [Alphaproteobacteria bacterium]MDP6876465.1 TetR/AcrR family transcriptional regulator [Alphaproteobacteria bacterium]
MRKGEQTRFKIMDIAEAAILAKGFDATSIEEIIEEAAITKSGFFYHFRDKNTLAMALLRRYIDREEALFDGLFGRAAELHEDPLHAFLIGLKLFAEMMSDLPAIHPGCLIAIYCYNERLYRDEIRLLSQESALAWRSRFQEILEDIAGKYPIKDEVDIVALADMVSSTFEGGIAMSKILRDQNVLPEQILLLRSYIKLLFLD